MIYEFLKSIKTKLIVLNINQIFSNSELRFVENFSDGCAFERKQYYNYVFNFFNVKKIH